LITTEDQRRWWFATHPEFRSRSSGHRTKESRVQNEDSEKVPPERVDAMVDEALEYEKDRSVVELLKLMKFWFGTEFERKSPGEKHALLWADDDDSILHQNNFDKSGRAERSTDPPAGSVQASRQSKDELENREDWKRAIELDKKGLESDPHTFLDALPLRRLATAPVGFLKEFFKSTARGTVVHATNKGGTRWKVGDDPLAPTSKGTAPAWSTQKVRTWKNEAAKEGAVEKWGAENVERMKKGLAPQREHENTGKWESKEFHHPQPQREGGKEVIDLWPEDHARVDYYRRLKKR
jgi:hypothetical protein